MKVKRDGGQILNEKTGRLFTREEEVTDRWNEYFDTA